MLGDDDNTEGYVDQPQHARQPRHHTGVPHSHPHHHNEVNHHHPHSFHQVFMILTN